jgi:hypothetical protein
MTFSVAEEASATVGHIEDPHLERVVRRAGDQERLAGQRAHSTHGAAMRVTHLRRQLTLLQVPERDMARRGPTQQHRKSCAATRMYIIIGINAVLGICDILVRIRIRIPGSVPLTNGSESYSGSDSFFHDAKKLFFSYFFLIPTHPQP